MIRIFVIIGMFLFANSAQAQPACPDGKTCRSVALTDDQWATLEQLVSNTCITGPYSQVKTIVDFYKDALLPKPPEPKK